MVRWMVLAVATGVAVVTACAPDVPSADARSSSGPAESARYAYSSEPLDPSLPNTLDELAPFFTGDLAPMGVRLTRAVILQLRAGPHLQLYVQPDQPSSASDYLDRLVPLVRTTGPPSFARWPSLATFDICQEPFGAESSQSTAPVTVVFLTRQQVDAVTWSDATIADIRKVVASLPGGEATVDDEVEALSEWRQAEPR